MEFPPVLADFKSFFDRDFNYGTGNDSVRDTDVNRGLLEANAYFNAALFDTSANGDGPIAFCYLAAHCMRLNIEAAGGLTTQKNGGFHSAAEGVITSKGIGSVNMSMSDAERFRESPTLSQFLLTPYGRKFLQLVAPKLVGNVFNVQGLDDIDNVPGGFNQITNP